MEVGKVLIPAVMLAGTLLLAVWWKVPRLDIRRSAAISGRSVHIISAHPELSNARVIVLESTPDLQAKTAEGKRLVTVGGLNEEAADWKRKFGQLQPGEFAVTRAGALSCDYVVFAVCPAEGVLSFTTSLLQSLNEGLHAASIALPLFPSSPPQLFSALQSAWTTRSSNPLSDLFIYTDSETDLSALNKSL